MRRIVIDELLLRAHAKLPLEKLGHGHITRIAHQEDNALTLEMNFRMLVTRIIAQIIIMGKKYRRQPRIMPLEIVEIQQVTRIQIAF